MSGVGLRSERGPILLALMLAIFLIAIDATILSTAVPTIVSDLGGFDQFPWLFSVYLLAQVATVRSMPSSATRLADARFCSWESDSSSSAPSSARSRGT